MHDGWEGGQDEEGITVAGDGKSNSCCSREVLS